MGVGRGPGRLSPGDDDGLEEIWMEWRSLGDLLDDRTLFESERISDVTLMSFISLATVLMSSRRCHSKSQ